ncbi:MAG: hypothetical protein M9894_36790 [Planctomycetes bacterium]|nr:hypothetical protein [Planctomycetota bacterium]
MTASWPPGRGAVALSARPSLLTALPRTSARTGSPRARASSARARSSAAPPSPRTKPSARRSKGRQRPVGDRAQARDMVTKGVSERFRFTPPTSARSHSPASRLRRARCRATSDDEQAVSIARAGPRRSNVWATFAAIMFLSAPVETLPGRSWPAAIAASTCSW